MVMRARAYGAGFGAGFSTGFGDGLAGWSVPWPSGSAMSPLHPWPTGGLTGDFHPWPTIRANSAGLHPRPTDNLRQAELHPRPTDGLRSASWPPEPGARAAIDDGVPRPIFPATASSWPWTYVDPAWVYDSEDALLAQAMRKMRAKILRPSDPRLPARAGGLLVPPDTGAAALWRWDAPFRVQAVVAELMGRVAIEDAKYADPDALAEVNSSRSWRLWSVSPGGRRVAAVLELVPPADGFEYSPQVDKVVRAAVEREDRLPEILSQLVEIRQFFGAVTGLNAQPLPAIAELLQVAWEWATLIVMRLKHCVAELRPFQRSAQVIPVIDTPGHGSLPSGHATMAALTAELLARVLYPNVADPHEANRRDMLHRLAARIAFNRVVAGVHFQMDSAAGQALGLQLARLFAGMAGDHARVESKRCVIRSDSGWDEADPTRDSMSIAAAGDFQPARCSALKLMWDRAGREWQQFRP